ncbi:hypothetical protein HMPREF0663_10950 [Hoylesella oralis ATCC 33269]|uniref:Uncharacterized protein n=1 Tax=Hoylesella oralis ATCC 33269 TaxID=873533 RepID=E7RP49_9BACT|nr:hypothetical protein HMPREF0663_10950 [Hoylesella oralis ATCC 33269]
MPHEWNKMPVCAAFRFHKGKNMPNNRIFVVGMKIFFYLYPNITNC